MQRSTEVSAIGCRCLSSDFGPVTDRGEGTTVGVIADAYDAMRAVGRSRDHAVTVTLGGRGQVDVELADDVTATHTEEELAHQVGVAARLALATYRHEQKVAIDEAVEQARSAS